MLAIYLDDSRKCHPLGGSVEYEIHTIAGYLAPVEMWDNEFIPRWNGMLKNEFAKAVSEFKRADVGGEVGYAEYESWSRGERNSMVARVVDEIVHPRYETMFGVGAVMVFERPPEASKKTIKTMRDRALEATLHETILSACDIAKGFWGPQSMHIYCDPQPKLMGRLKTIWDEHVRPAAINAYGAPISSLDFTKHSHELEPLQAADLWAWELRNDLERRSAGQAMFYSLRRLLDGRPHISYLIEADTYLQRADAQQGKDDFEGFPLLCVSPHILPSRPNYPFIEDDRPSAPFLPLRYLPVDEEL